MNPSFIHFSNLKKHFQMGSSLVRALDGITMDIPSNSFTVVMGPSGSGKSTLLYLVGGLDRPTSGQIVVDGQHVHEMDENELAFFRRHTVGFIFQSFNLIPSMTAMDNVGFPMQFSGKPTAERNTRSQELLKRVGLEERGHHHPSELSGGQQQRVAIARSLVNNPRLILADEPTGNLDTSSGLSIMQLLSELHQTGSTVLVVTHDPRMMRFATHKIFLLDGQVVSEEQYHAATME